MKLTQAMVERVSGWLEDARSSPMKEPMAVALATTEPAGRVSARIVLLRGFDAEGFIFYTNSESDKGRQLASHPHGALCFYWDSLGRQLRVEGPVAPVDDTTSDHYWNGRPRSSQISAWASKQSATMQDFQQLQDRVQECEQRFAGTEVPRPPHWFGYRLPPDRIEFWTSGEARRHLRELFEWREGRWQESLLFP